MEVVGTEIFTFNLQYQSFFLKAKSISSGRGEWKKKEQKEEFQGGGGE